MREAGTRIFQALGLIATLLAQPVMAQSADLVTVAVDGTCERLVIADEDLTDQCGTALVQILEGNSVDLFIATGGQGLFGLARPERMMIFRGLMEGPAAPWTDHDVAAILLGAARARQDVETVAVRGACRYEDPAKGPATIACTATDRDGRFYEVRYRSDGLPPVSF